MIILDDYREWKSQQEERVGTHSDRCHMWPRHEACMIHRLAAALEEARLTDKEVEAIKAAIRHYEDYDMDAGCWHAARTLRGLLERHFPASEKRSLQDNDPSGSENLPPGNDAPKTHANSDKFPERADCTRDGLLDRTQTVEK